MKNKDDPKNNRTHGVFSVLFDADDSAQDLDFFTQINANFVSETNGESTNFKINLKSLFERLPEKSTFWHYEGSLITPTCDEICNWYINKNYIRVNSKQLKQMRFLWVTGTFNSIEGQGNNRLTQPLGDRLIHTG